MLGLEWLWAWLGTRATLSLVDGWDVQFVLADRMTVEPFGANWWRVEWWLGEACHLVAVVS